MPTPQDVLMNREQYPDDLEFDWMGEKHTLKVWRQQMLPMGEFTKVRQQATARIQELEQTQLQLQQQLAAAMNQQSRQVVAPTGDDDDPYIAPIRQELRTLTQAIAEMRAATVEDRKQQQLGSWMAQINSLKEQDADVDAEAIVRYAAAEGLRDMTKAYKLMRHDDMLKAAEQRGFDRGKKATPPAFVPGGKRGGSAPVIPGGTPPQSMAEALNAAIHDPEIASIFNGEHEG